MTTASPARSIGIHILQRRHPRSEGLSLVPATTMSDEYLAIVCYPPNPVPNWKVENVKVARSPNEHELKVRMLATGICHSDIIVSSIPDGAPGMGYPRILGHEGAGIVEEVGSGVTVAQVGDPILLSYNFCRNCDLCHNDQQPYCMNWFL